MYRTPGRTQRSPGAPRPDGRFPSPGPGWGFPGPRPPYGGSGHYGGSPREGPTYSPVSPVYSPGYSRGYRDRSPAGFGGGSRGFGDSPAGFRGGSRSFGESPSGYRGGNRGFGGQMWRGSGGSRRPNSFQSGSSDAPVEKYFSPSMLQDPWATLQLANAAHANTHTHAT